MTRPARKMKTGMGMAARGGRIPGHGGSVLRFPMRGIRELRNFAPPRPFINGAILFFPAGGEDTENPEFPTDSLLTETSCQSNRLRFRLPFPIVYFIPAKSFSAFFHHFNST
ncbi:hypothetical protein HMPREF3039_00297 [Akkermansia sp. KLE1798]|nr:hypothetical protein HMPREF3039_00297 [Akkermansia sp. KLE1798]